jgi:hypothetical protein
MIGFNPYIVGILHIVSQTGIETAKYMCNSPVYLIDENRSSEIQSID